MDPITSLKPQIGVDRVPANGSTGYFIVSQEPVTCPADRAPDTGSSGYLIVSQDFTCPCCGETVAEADLRRKTS